MQFLFLFSFCVHLFYRYQLDDIFPLKYNPFHLKLSEPTSLGSPHLQTQIQAVLVCPLLLFPVHLLPSPVHPTGFSFCLSVYFYLVTTTFWFEALTLQMCYLNLNYLHTDFTLTREKIANLGLLQLDRFLLIMNQTEFHLVHNPKHIKVPNYIVCN